MTSEVDPDNVQVGTTAPQYPWIPPELLRHVFEYLVPSIHSGNNRPRIEGTLCLVSKFWRAVALSTPQLWTIIEINTNRTLKNASIYLKRAGPLAKLDFRINIYKYDQMITQKSERKALLLQSALAFYIAENIHRTRRLSCFCFHKTTLNSVMNAISRSTAPYLEELVLKYELISDSRPRLPGSPFLDGGAPMLRFMETDTIDSRSIFQCFQNLTTLYLHGLDGATDQSYTTFVTLLRAPKALLYLSMQGRIDLSTWPLHMQGPQFRLAHLKGLRLLDDGMMAVKFILSVNAPALESLWLDCSFDNFHHLFDSPQVSGFGAGPKFPSLKYLTLPNDNLHYTPHFTKLCPTITHLHFPHANFHHSATLQAALINGWPSLDTLVFTMYRERNSKNLYTSLVHAFVQRSVLNRPIKYLFVDEDLHDDMPRSAFESQVQVAVIDPLLYREAWWNKLDQLRSEKE